MIYLDGGATSFPKPLRVRRAVWEAMERCANPGRGGYGAAMEADRLVFRCRELAGELFSCLPEQVVITPGCTQGLNIAIRSLVPPGGKVVVSGFEHNAVMRPLHALGAEIRVAGRRLFDPEDTLREFDKALRDGPDAAVFTHTSNVFGYRLPVEKMAGLCKKYGVPFILDAAQGAGSCGISMDQLGAAFVAMPGHKGLLGPQGVGLLLCSGNAEPLVYGGTGAAPLPKEMPLELPERLEAGTLNVPGIGGLAAGLETVLELGPDAIGRREAAAAARCAGGLQKLGIRVFHGKDQGGTVSFVTAQDCELVAQALAQRGIAVRAGLHCAPLAHQSAGTLSTGTVRISFGHLASAAQADAMVRAMAGMITKS